MIDVGIDRGTSGTRRIIDRRLHGALRADPSPVGAFQGAPATVGVVQALRALAESATRGRALVPVRLGEHEAADPAGAVHGLVRRRDALAQVRGPVALGEASLASFGGQTRRAVAVGVASARALSLLLPQETRLPRLLYRGARPIVNVGFFGYYCYLTWNTIFNI